MVNIDKDVLRQIGEAIKYTQATIELMPCGYAQEWKDASAKNKQILSLLEPYLSSVGELRLTQGKVAIIDIDDLELLNRWKWHHNKGYPRRVEKGEVILMSRFITKAPKGMVVDHINGNPLDNRRSNLRVCRQQDNQHNRASKVGSSKYKGVSWNKWQKIWEAYIVVNSKQLYLGKHKDEKQAALAYNAAAAKHFGEFARLNII